MNLGNLIIVILILLLFICLSVKSKVLKPFVLTGIVLLLILFEVYSKKEKFSESYMIISEEKLNEINLENQKYLIQRNLLVKLNKKLLALETILNRITR